MRKYRKSWEMKFERNTYTEIYHFLHRCIFLCNYCVLCIYAFSPQNKTSWRIFFDKWLFSLIHVNYIFLHVYIFPHMTINEYAVFLIQMNGTIACELNPGELYLAFVIGLFLLWTFAPPMAHFWLHCLLLLSSVCVLPLTDPHTDPTSAPACYLYSSTIDIPYPRKDILVCHEPLFPPCMFCEKTWQVPETHDVLIPLQIVSHRGRDTVFKDTGPHFILIIPASS